VKIENIIKMLGLEGFFVMFNSGIIAYICSNQFLKTTITLLKNLQLKKYFLFTSFCFLLVLNAFSQNSLVKHKYSFTQNKMGSPFTITLSTLDTTNLNKVIVEAFNHVDVFNNIFSDYEPLSETNLLNQAPRNIWMKVSKPLMEVLIESQYACELSGGAFDVSIGKLTKQWRKLKKMDDLKLSLSLKKELKEILKYVGCKVFSLDTTNLSVMKDNDQFAFDFGAIAKGYIAEQIGLYLKSTGFSSYLIDAGGDLVAGDAPENSQGWAIALNAPGSEETYGSFIKIRNQSIATSGSTYQNIKIGGQVYSHILNPKTGLGVQALRNITIIAPHGSQADWMATANLVLPFKKAKKIIDKSIATSMIYMENVNGQIIVRKAGQPINY
jgi:FAD:protein FMN transferase